MGGQQAGRIAAVIGHADEPDLLRRCIAHHLAIGVGSVFVSLNTEDPQSVAVVDEFAASGRVRGEPVERFAADPFQFFTAAIEAVRSWSDPGLVLFVDTDEFWIPRSGDINRTQGLDQADVLRVWRYNAPAVLRADGTIAWPRPGPACPVFEPGADPDDWLRSRVGPKVLARTPLVREVMRGGHDVVAADGARRAVAQDLVVVHLPITSRERFQRKMRAIRARLSTYADRFTSSQALHWKRWVELEDRGLLESEFASMLLGKGQLAPLLAEGRLTTPARLFAQWAAV